ncbi:hypothetical protein Sdia_13110 [Streptomyces diastaticus subsp. diastaticus]|uniref:Transposase n=1 Tax=Streptomyces diastaticus subsp. diastaticus TaxID=68040 RepID=A0ABQ1CK78_STRDI|nr:hypothetical protein Sdia_13110 [Streptomyces diastaticus subsp. diastaticus]GGU35012.1 hypothetical protein GCM10015534_42070 [Streptomyces diastaticus subsp. diastaticus]
MSRLVTEHHGLQCLAVVGVDRGETDEEGQSVRVRQDVHRATRLAPVNGARDQIKNRRWTVDLETPKHGGKARQAQPLTRT